MTAVNVTIMPVVADLTHNLCEQNDLFGHLHPIFDRTQNFSFNYFFLLLSADLYSGRG
jgi:hypothetical protein